MAPARSASGSVYQVCFARAQSHGAVARPGRDPSMKLRVEKHDTALVLELEGELDVDGSAELEERCLYEQQEGARHFVVSLGAVEPDHRPGPARPARPRPQPAPLRAAAWCSASSNARVEEALRVSGLDGAFVTAPNRAAALERSRELQSTAPPDAAGEPRRGAGARSTTRSRSWARASRPRVGVVSRSRA